jgi:F420-dependent oxidoreductase-like protein
MPLQYSGGFLETVAELRDYEQAGVEIVFVPEAYSFDAVSQLGFIAARTESMQIASGILQIYTRTPTLTAMTAAGLDYVSGGRFTLGLGASGPQVVEGFHGVPYDAPLGRTREVIEICRQVWRREKVEHQGRYYQVPLPPGAGTGLGKPLRLINHPLRERIPIMLAAIGPKNVALAAEVADAWEPLFFHPRRARDVWGDSELGPLDVVVGMPLAVGPDVDHLVEHGRAQLALYIGGMGARGKNFYNDLACRYGFESEAATVQDLYLSGRKDEAAAAVPQELLHATSLIGSAAQVRDKLAELAEAGATTLNLHPAQASHTERLRSFELVRGLAS